MRMCVLALLLASCVSGARPEFVDSGVEAPAPDVEGVEPDLELDASPPDFTDLAKDRFCGPDVEFCPPFTYLELACTDADGNPKYDGCGRRCWICGNSGRTNGCTSDILPGVVCTWKCRC